MGNKGLQTAHSMHNEITAPVDAYLCNNLTINMQYQPPTNTKAPQLICALSDYSEYINNAHIKFVTD